MKRLAEIIFNLRIKEIINEKENKNSLIVLGFLAFLSFVFVFVIKGKFSIDILEWSAWNDWITFLTFLLAGVIGWQGYMARWQDNLPNKMTVHFVYDGDCVMSYYYVDLVAESEIRTWGQQIGMQMNKNSYLALNPIIKKKPMEIINVDASSSFKHYEATFSLSLEPKIFKANDALSKKYLTCYFHGEDVVKKLHERVKSPLSIEEAKLNGIKIDE